MNSRLKKIICLILASLLVVGAGQFQTLLNHDRDTLGLTRGNTLDNAPPALAFTTVALGGFRGLISNLLWMRASDLQQDDKFFEAAQLAEWITKLEPTYAQVWVFQGWNMAYNISVKFKDFPDRWRWLENGISLMRDEALRYNPNNVDIYRELSWFFQHKMGANLDDANMYYKQQWAIEMKDFFGTDGTNFTALLQPKTAEELAQLQFFTNKYKMDPQFIKTVDDQYGPFDWRLPEAHAIYWADLGLAEAKAHPDKVNASDLIKLRRSIYQSMLQAFHHGRIINDPLRGTYLGPNLGMVNRVNAAYEQLYQEETEAPMRDGILKAHRNFLRDAVYFLYEANRMPEAAKWFKYLGDRYPDKTIIDGDPTSLPKNLTLDEYAVAVIQIDIGETSQERVEAAVEGILIHAYHDLALGNDDRYENFKRLAAKVYARYGKTTSVGNGDKRIPLQPYDILNREVLSHLLDPQQGYPYAMRAVIRTQLGLPAETAATNAAPPTATAPVAPATNEPAK